MKNGKQILGAARESKLVVKRNAIWEANLTFCEEVAAFKMGRPPARGKTLPRDTIGLLGREVYISDIEGAIESALASVVEE